MSLSRNELIRTVDSDEIRFVCLQFTDLVGHLKSIEIPRSRLEPALDGEIFLTSPVEGFEQVEQLNLKLLPDFSTFCVYPWNTRDGSKVARLLCDIYKSNEEPFEGCPRLTLKRQVEKINGSGCQPMMAPEIEFFLFSTDEHGRFDVSQSHDIGKSFDGTPTDKDEEIRLDMIRSLEQMNLRIKSAHHEIAPNQHEIALCPSDAIHCADSTVTLRSIVRKIASNHGSHVTWMPKPRYGIEGSGMHVYQTLRDVKGENIFFSNQTNCKYSNEALHYIGGILKHADSFVAVTNPLVNSYKRLVLGFDAPTEIAWSEKNDNVLVCVWTDHQETYCEIRVPDPSCNPYLAFTTMLAAGMDGFHQQIDPGSPLKKNILAMTPREKKRLKIRTLPSSLSEALAIMEKNQIIQEALGNYIFFHHLQSKQQEVEAYNAYVHPWELERYIEAY